MTHYTHNTTCTLTDQQIEHMINRALNNMDYQRRRMAASWIKTKAANVVHLEQRIRGGHGDAVKRYRKARHSIVIDVDSNLRLHPTNYNDALDQVKARHGWSDASTESTADPVTSQDFRSLLNNI